MNYGTNSRMRKSRPALDSLELRSIVMSCGRKNSPEAPDGCRKMDETKHDAGVWRIRLHNWGLYLNSTRSSGSLEQELSDECHHRSGIRPTSSHRPRLGSQLRQQSVGRCQNRAQQSVRRSAPRANCLAPTGRCNPQPCQHGRLNSAIPTGERR